MNSSAFALALKYLNKYLELSRIESYASTLLCNSDR